MVTRGEPIPGALAKCPTGILGFEEISKGGLPEGRVTLIAGGPGCGKTLFGMQFLVHGARACDEPGVFISMEEPPAKLLANFRSMGWELDDLVESGRLSLDYVHVDPEEVRESGDYDLEGLVVRIEHAIDEIGARRVVIDGIEALFSGLKPDLVRAELRRLCRRLEDRGVTAIVTAESAEGRLTRWGIQEWLTDCVIVLEHTIEGERLIRRMRIVKYRGTAHEADLFPFLIDNNGITVLPITSLGLDAHAPRERISSGIDAVDEILGGQGFFRGSSVLVSGTAGTGKTSFSGEFVNSACGRGERVLYLAFEESPRQIIRNMQSIGIDLAPYEEQGLLRFRAARPTFSGLEGHLVQIYALIEAHDPTVAIVDPISNLSNVATLRHTRSFLTRIIDQFKVRNVTTLFTNLTTAGSALDSSEVQISSLMDTWMLLQFDTTGRRRRRMFNVIKSRGMNHDSDMRPYRITSEGIQFLPYEGREER